MSNKVAIALIGIIPAVLTAVLGYVQGTKENDLNRTKAELDRRIDLKSSPNPNYKQLTYPNYGLSLLVPVSWTAEDAPARLAGGEFNLISRYEDTKGSIGLNFRLRPVQPNYIGDISAQVQNQMDVLRKIDSTASVADVSISGLQGKIFHYQQPTGLREMSVRLYWIRVVPDVQLQILAANYTDAADAQQFWQEVDKIISFTTIAFDSWQDRRQAID